MHKVVATSDVLMPSANTHYDLLSLTVNLQRETLVVIYASAGLANSSQDTVMQAFVYVDGNQVIHGDEWIKAGIGETVSMATVLVLGTGQHVIKLRGYSWANDGFGCGDDRTQLVVMEG
jgi:hypothetical protein